MQMHSPQVPEQFAAEEALADAFRSGWQHGHGIACHNVPRLGDKIDRSVDHDGLGPIVTAENVRDYHAALCYAAEENSRQFSPFECTAHEFNSAEGEGESEALWEAFDAGTNDAIQTDLSGYTDDLYGIEDESDSDGEDE